MRTVGSTGRRSETKENLFSFCEQGGTEEFCFQKSTGRRSETKENLFSFCEQGGTEGFCEAKA